MRARRPVCLRPPAGIARADARIAAGNGRAASSRWRRKMAFTWASSIFRSSRAIRLRDAPAGRRFRRIVARAMSDRARLFAYQLHLDDGVGAGAVVVRLEPDRLGDDVRAADVN